LEKALIFPHLKIKYKICYGFFFCYFRKFSPTLRLFYFLLWKHEFYSIFLYDYWCAQFLLFILFIDCTILINFQVLNEPCISGINSICSWYFNLFLWLDSVYYCLIKDIYSYHKEHWYEFSFLYFGVVIIKWVAKYYIVLAKFVKISIIYP
jgi:hypothetical protein